MKSVNNAAFVVVAAKCDADTSGVAMTWDQSERVFLMSRTVASAAAVSAAPLVVMSGETMPSLGYVTYVKYTAPPPSASPSPPPPSASPSPDGPCSMSCIERGDIYGFDLGYSSVSSLCALCAATTNCVAFTSGWDWTKGFFNASSDTPTDCLLKTSTNVNSYSDNRYSCLME